MQDEERQEKKPTYTVLGESGLAIDEDGELVSVFELEWLEKHPEAARQDVTDASSSPASPTEPSSSSATSSSSSSSKSFGIASVLDEKSNPAYWYYYYDPRYCGPSREAYMEKMARQYARPTAQAAPPASEREEDESLQEQEGEEGCTT